MLPISIIPIAPVEEHFISFLKKPVETLFNSSVTIEKVFYPKIDNIYDPYRNQYNSTLLLDVLFSQFKHIEGKFIGIFAEDLFIPVFTYVFGEAMLDNKAAVVSFKRFDENFYGMKYDINFIRQRLLKETVHELGHTFGLVHCKNYNCVMHFSAIVEDIDIKPSAFCETCQTFILGKGDGA